MEHLNPQELTLSFAVLTLGLLGACDEPLRSSRSSAEAARGLEPQTSCVTSPCTFCHERERNRYQSCSECLSFCAGATQPSCYSECDTLCSTHEDCTAACEDTTTCYEHAITFRPYGEPDPAVEASCLRSLEHQAACGMALADPADPCLRFATLEDPSFAIPAYDCISALPCDATIAEFQACLPRSRHGLADWYCQLSTARGQAACDASIRSRLESADGWMLASSARALQACDAPEGNDVDLDTCVLAWLTAVEPDAGMP